MKIICDTQGTDEWIAARRGKITASNARLARSRRNTKGRRRYVEKLADDVEGIPNFGDDGMIEIKYRLSLRTFHEHAAKGANASVMPQAQLGMFVCDRRWCDYVNYWRSDEHEKEEGAIERIERDDAYIYNELLPGCIRIWADVQALLKIRGVL